MLINSLIAKHLGFIVTTKDNAGPSGRAVGSNPTGDMDVCLLWVLCVVR